MTKSDSAPPLTSHLDLQAQLLELSLEEMTQLKTWLKAAIKERRAEVALQEIPVQKGREVVETRRVGKTTYVLEAVKCGKKKCKCNEGKLHGPYWYAYRWNGKKLKSTYIGKQFKQLPEDS